MIRGALIADLHAGHARATTLPPWQWPTVGGTEERNRAGEIQLESCEKLEEIIKAEKPFDFVVGAGDMIHGQMRDALMTTHDRDEQVQQAAAIVKMFGAGEVLLVAGTPRHTGDLEKWERVLAAEVDAKFGSRVFFEIDGVRFVVRHKVGRSRIPHGKATPVMRQAVWNEINAAREKEPKADVLLFGHTHYHLVVEVPEWTAMTLPALCCRTEFSDEQSEGDVHWGIVVVDIDGGRIVDRRSHTMTIRSDIPEVIHLCQGK